MYQQYRRPEAYAVLALIAVNLILFIASLFNRDLIVILGLQPSVWTGEPWTLLTNLFMHGGFFHIFANMLTLYFLGSYLCNIIRDLRFLIVYFVGGIAGNFCYIAISSYTTLGNPNSIVIGASGAVFAIAGALTVLTPKMKIMIFPIPAPIPLWIAILGGFLLVSFIPYVAWQAHLGGLLVGLAAGFIFRKQKLAPVIF